ncbi:hypothetical protein DNK48_36460 [Streptomyces malaysiensis subsp. malaysiensis]|uniref:Uncharacterized protein n=2 Tax=Streptomyces TaxID=1883 RepID=A0A2J7Z7G5_STRMQ|nr:hypothetical protein BV401_10840 [Streptomyces autolyticus]PNG96119.1 hypothetical protein SMF913_12144 [Streptomyces malaysiensis]QDL73933.1 hypothetical protein DNK48_36460 [Streptomyces malaysiensis]
MTGAGRVVLGGPAGAVGRRAATLIVVVVPIPLPSPSLFPFPPPAFSSSFSLLFLGLAVLLQKRYGRTLPRTGLL